MAMMATSRYYVFLIAVAILFVVSIVLFSKTTHRRDDGLDDNIASSQQDLKAIQEQEKQKQHLIDLILDLKSENQKLRQQAQELHEECSNKDNDNKEQQQQQQQQQHHQKPPHHSQHQQQQKQQHHYRLVIGIPTIERPSKTSYLDQTLDSYVRQLSPSPATTALSTSASSIFAASENVLVLVMDMSDAKGKPHDAFDQARQKYGKYPFFKFLTNKHYARKPREASTFYGTERQRETVMQQSMDLTALLDAAVLISSDFFMFMEDDMTVCGNALKAVMHLIEKAVLYHENFMCIRASFGMNGIIMHNLNYTTTSSEGKSHAIQNDVKRYADYMFSRYERRPPDHLIVEFCAAETEESRSYVQKRTNVGYRYNLFHHLGKVSSIRGEQHWGFPTCYDELLVPTVFEVEGFNPKQCPHDDIWPCNVPEEKKQVYPWIKFKN